MSALALTCPPPALRVPTPPSFSAFLALISRVLRSFYILSLILYTLKDSPSADAALQAEELHQVDGRRLRVERAKVNRTLFVAKFSLALLPAELRKLAESFGEVESVTIIKHHVTNKSKGCGFIKYRFREDAADAFTGIKAKNKKWVVEWATSANDPELLGVAKNLVYVGGLPFDRVTEPLLRDHFSVYGPIDEVSIIHPNPHFLRRDQAVPLSPTSQASSSHTADPHGHISTLSNSSLDAHDIMASTAGAASNTMENADTTTSAQGSSSSAPTSTEQDPNTSLASSSIATTNDSTLPSGDGKSDNQGLTTSATPSSGASRETSEVSLARSASRGGSSNLGPSSTSSVAPSALDTSSTTEPTVSSKGPTNVAAAHDDVVPGVAEEASGHSNLGTLHAYSTSPTGISSLSANDVATDLAPADSANASAAASNVPLVNGKPVTSYAFITFTEPHSAAAAIENEDGSTFLGVGPIRVQYCETPDMKLRKKLAKMRDAYPATGSPVVLTDPATAASYTAMYGHSVPHASALAGRHNAPTLVAGPTGPYVPHHHVHPSAHRGHPSQVPQYAYFQGTSPQAGYVTAGNGRGSSSLGSAPGTSPGGMIGNLGVSALGGPSATGAGPAGYWPNAMGSNPTDGNGWYYVGPAAPLSINVPSKDLMLDLSGLSLDPTSPVAVPLGFPFSPSPTFTPLGFPPMSQLSPLTGPGMPYFPLPSYGLASSSGSASSATPSSPSSTHSDRHNSQGNIHSITSPGTNSNNSSMGGSPSAGKASTSPTVSSANKASAKV